MAIEVVVGATRKNLVWNIVDSTTGAPVNVAGGSARLQGMSDDLPAFTSGINQAGVITDAPNGIFTWAGIGSYLVPADLAGKAQATFKLRVRFQDASAKVDYDDEFEIVYVKQPV
jgi:hypothetical protein